MHSQNKQIVRQKKKFSFTLKKCDNFFIKKNVMQKKIFKKNRKKKN